MKDFKVNDIDKQIRLSKIIFGYTTTQTEYEMERILLLESDKYGEYILLEGYHCSCYDFDEVEWEGLLLNEEELKKLVLSKNFGVGFDGDVRTRKKLKDFCRYYFDWKDKGAIYIPEIV